MTRSEQPRRRFSTRLASPLYSAASSGSRFLPLDIVPSVCTHDCPSTCALDVERIDQRRLGRGRGAAMQDYTRDVVCAGGGYAAKAASIDHRIKAVATASAVNTGASPAIGKARARPPSSWPRSARSPSSAARRLRVPRSRTRPMHRWPAIFVSCWPCTNTPAKIREIIECATDNRSRANQAFGLLRDPVWPTGLIPLRRTVIESR